MSAGYYLGHSCYGKASKDCSFRPFLPSLTKTMAEHFPAVRAQRDRYFSLDNFHFAAQKAALFSSSVCNIKTNFIYFSLEFLVHLADIHSTDIYVSALCQAPALALGRHQGLLCLGRKPMRQEVRVRLDAEASGVFGLGARGSILAVRPTSLTLTLHLCRLGSWSLLPVLGLFLLPVTLVNGWVASGGWLCPHPPRLPPEEGGGNPARVLTGRLCEEQRGGRAGLADGGRGVLLLHGGRARAGPTAAASVRSLFLPDPGAFCPAVGLLLLSETGGQRLIRAEIFTGCAFHALALFSAPGRQQWAAQGSDEAGS
ncbi:uncharacterized protein LOC102900020 [Felis catus]|uniref:uncharacterized protein LOC102900020 n=1 Tax=Felis catus TaxID=9685 RepID=UPI001D1A0D17|nr:uncharacterized protein LOC102900020 [Felis catus]XP_044905642.1 uncharacterized protein LOC102900020 [Felis catus]XP_044905643.1 uncharacterized protein LOC102900020 [Felis catus]XP_044905644.1 uncharacterized protein LOC102900020 [Felis catus]XP_044905645.1 uncharacterized protein LOC102900020 [Felis catus]XP_044905647.1 uncharacterized protein LOC102900020 [Felis catus]XP_044905648.1 uncharacterized protein LOC102900020 [Felis catus]XP_044905649.1 uncharacterized protein LOC102900020 [